MKSPVDLGKLRTGKTVLTKDGKKIGTVSSSPSTSFFQLQRLNNGGTIQIQATQVASLDEDGTVHLVIGLSELAIVLHDLSLIPKGMRAYSSSGRRIGEVVSNTPSYVAVNRLVDANVLTIVTERDIERVSPDGVYLKLGDDQLASQRRFRFAE